MARPSARERILDASIALFAERGYRHTTTRMIADSAGVNEVTLFRHFGTKEGIVKAIIQNRSSAITEIRNVLQDDATEDLYTDLLRAAKIQYKYVSENLELLLTLVQGSGAEDNVTEFVAFLPRAVKETLMFYFDRMQACGLMRSTDSEQSAVSFMTSTFGLAIVKQFFGDSVATQPSENHIEANVQNFVRSLKV